MGKWSQAAERLAKYSANPGWTRHYGRIGHVMSTTRQYSFSTGYRTPLLIIHGAEDETVPVSAADEVFVDLRRLGQEVEYARYSGENHVEAGWSFANQKDYMMRVLRWFDDVPSSLTCHPEITRGMTIMPSRYVVNR